MGNNLDELWPLNLSQEESKSCISCTVPGGLLSKIVSSHFMQTVLFSHCLVALKMGKDRTTTLPPNQPCMDHPRGSPSPYVDPLGKLLSLFVTTSLLKEHRRNSQCCVRRYFKGSFCASLRRISLPWACLQCPSQALCISSPELFSSPGLESFLPPRALCYPFIVLRLILEP